MEIKAWSRFTLIETILAKNSWCGQSVSHRRGCKCCFSITTLWLFQDFTSRAFSLLRLSQRSSPDLSHSRGGHQSPHQFQRTKPSGSQKVYRRSARVDRRSPRDGEVPDRMWAELFCSLYSTHSRPGVPKLWTVGRIWPASTFGMIVYPSIFVRSFRIV